MSLESFFTGMAEKDAPTMELHRFLVEFQPIGPGLAELVELCHPTYLQKIGRKNTHHLGFSSHFNMENISQLHQSK